MGLPSKPNAPESQNEPTDAVVRDPSYPDRARIDSDVRAFLRPASSPWIVFDRDSRVDDFAKSALRVGAVFASSPSLREETKSSAEMRAPVETPVPLLGPMIPMTGGPPHTTMNVEMTEKVDAFAPGRVLPHTMSSVSDRDPKSKMFPAFAAAEPAVEPSNVVVASDVSSESAVALEAVPVARETIESDPFAIPGLVPKRSRAVWMAGACAGVLAIVGVTSVAVARPSRVAKAEGHAVEKTSEPLPSAQPVAPPAVVEPAPVVVASPLAPEASTESSSERTGKMSSDPKRRFGRLTIKADGKTKNVWFDGKRMLGTGTRSFMVFCGMHTVAINDKADAKDIEVPCNGEFTAQAK